MDRPRHDELLEIIGAARRRLRIRQLLHGASVVVLAAVLLVLFASYGVDQFRFSPGAVIAFRTLVVAGPLALAVWLIARPLLSPVSDSRIALYLEEHAPALEARLLSAVEYVRREGEAPRSLGLVDRLVAEAVECCAAIHNGRRIEQAALVRSAGILAGTMLVGAALLLVGPGSVRRGAAGLVPWGGERNPYRIEVSPRDTVVARGSDLKVTALLRHFTADRVEIAVRRGPQGEWQRFPLLAEPSGGHAIVLFDLEDATDYFVEASGVRSDLVRVGVADLPHVRRIDLEYHFPTYTGLPEQRVEDGGDIAAVRGTRVNVEVTPTIRPVGASLVVGGKDTVRLTLKGTSVLAGQITVDRPTSYRVVFQSAGAGSVVGSPEYAIDVLSDQPPTVQFRSPGRDLQVTSVEEVFTEAEARDDYGVARLELIYQVNGGDEHTVRLGPGAGARQEVVGSHTFFLEEQGLRPGDLVSYYARAVEADHAGGAQRATTDIYFLQVRPFEREYRAADQQPSGGGGGGEASPGELSQRQREVVAGTFNLVRDSAQYTASQRRENLATLALAQRRLREDVETLVGRIRGRGVIDLDSTFAIVAASLDTALREMAAAEDRLGERKPKDALTPEQRALQQLQRAEAAYREIQVARSNQGGGGGGAGEQRSAEELADLFDLEMDRLRNQYEQVERGQRQEMDNQLDETLERLRELARRQQQENERLRARMDEMASGAGAGGAASTQRELAQQTEELARRLERLAREQQQPELNRTARDLREAADAMRRAAAQAGSEGAARGRNALDQLRQAQRSLEQDRGERLKRDVEDALRRTRQLAEQQQDVQDEVGSLTGQGASDQQRIQRLDQRKQGMAQQVEDLERDIDQMSRESAREQRDASRKLGEAASGIRDDKLREKILYSRGVIRGRSPEYARNFEDQIGADIEALEQRLGEARDAIGESREQRVGRALERANELVNGLESLQERLRNQQAGRAQSSAAERGRAAEAGQQQGQEGQQGQRGQQGQQGQPGQSGQTPQGGQPGQPGGIDRGGQGFGGWLGPYRRQFDREWRERLGDADRLRSELRAEGVEVRDLDRIIQQLRGLDERLLSGDPRSLAVLENEVVQGLKEFEFVLRRQFAQGESDRPFSTGADEVPEKYRKMVEQYYKALSEKKP